MAADPGGAGSGVSGAATVGDVYCTSTADPEPAAALLHTLGLEDFKGSCRSCWSFNALGALEGPPGRTTLPLASWNCSPSSSSSIVTMRKTPVVWLRGDAGGMEARPAASTNLPSNLVLAFTPSTTRHNDIWRSPLIHYRWRGQKAQ